MRPRWKKGSALLQTLVMSVLLSMIAISMMKWVLARYTMSSRNYRSTQAKSYSQYYVGDQLSRWNLVNYPVNFAGIPTSGSFTIPGDNMPVPRKTVSYSRTGVNAGTGAPGVLTVTVDPD